jgi:hypothetical protein
MGLYADHCISNSDMKRCIQNTSSKFLQLSSKFLSSFPLSEEDSVQIILSHDDFESWNMGFALTTLLQNVISFKQSQFMVHAQ